VSDVGHFLKNKSQVQPGVYFVVQEEHRGQRAKPIAITPDTIQRMINHCQFKMPKINVSLSNKLATTEILLYLGSGEPYPISKFPRSLLQDEDSGKGQ